MLNPEILNLLTIYVKKYKELSNIYSDNLPRNLRQFNTRFKLAIDLKVDFYKQISLTETKAIRDLYSLVIKLTEIWNAYEALGHYTKELGLAVGNESMYKMYTQKFLHEVGSLSTLEFTLKSLKDKYSSNQRFRSCFDNYIKTINDETKISGNLKSSCNKILENFKDEKDISGIEIIALVYAERNMYYHNGETAQMGMRIGNRLKFLTELVDCFILHILKITINILEKEIEESQK